MSKQFICGTVVLVTLLMSQGLLADSITLNPASASRVSGDASTAAPGFGTGSWQAAAVGVGTKSELYIPVASLFSGVVTIDDLASVSYWTNKATTAAAVDWTFYIYTNRLSSGDNAATWYHTRLNSEPYFTSTPSVAANTWHQWSTNDPSNPMRFYDTYRSHNFGTYGDPTLADLPSSYDAESIQLFSLQTGSAWANGFQGGVDGLTVTLKNGQVGTVNLEPVPTPDGGMTIMLLGGVLVGLDTLRRRFRVSVSS